VCWQDETEQTKNLPKGQKVLEIWHEIRKNENASKLVVRKFRVFQKHFDHRGRDEIGSAGSVTGPSSLKGGAGSGPMSLSLA